MRCWKNRHNTIWFVLLIAMFSSALPAQAGSIQIEKAEARQTEDGYQLSAIFQIQLSPSIEMALQRGVTLHFVSKFSVSRSRWYWFDTDVMQIEQVSKLSYNLLTQQYRITRGSLYQSFYELNDVLKILGQVVVPSISNESLNKTGGGYISRILKKGSECCEAEVSMQLDVSQLPKPMQVNALANEEWKLESKPYHWELEISPEDEP